MNTTTVLEHLWELAAERPDYILADPAAVPRYAVATAEGYIPTDVVGEVLARSGARLGMWAGCGPLHIRHGCWEPYFPARRVNNDKALAVLMAAQRAQDNGVPLTGVLAEAERVAVLLEVRPASPA